MSDLDDLDDLDGLVDVDAVLASYLEPMPVGRRMAVARAAKAARRRQRAPVVPRPRTGEGGPEARLRAEGSARPDHDGA